MALGGPTAVSGVPMIGFPVRPKDVATGVVMRCPRGVYYMYIPGIHDYNTWEPWRAPAGPGWINKGLDSEALPHHNRI